MNSYVNQTTNSQTVRAEKRERGVGRFRVLSKLVYFKTQLLELVESSLEVPTLPSRFYLFLICICDDSERRSGISSRN